MDQSAWRALTFSLDLEHADGIFRAEAAELAGWERVSAALRPRGAHVERPQKRSCAHHRHGSDLSGEESEEEQERRSTLSAAVPDPNGSGSLSRFGIYSL